MSIKKVETDHNNKRYVLTLRQKNENVLGSIRNTTTTELYKTIDEKAVEWTNPLNDLVNKNNTFIKIYME